MRRSKFHNQRNFGLSPNERRGAFQDFQLCSLSIDLDQPNRSAGRNRFVEPYHLHLDFAAGTADGGLGQVRFFQRKQRIMAAGRPNEEFSGAPFVGHGCLMDGDDIRQPIRPDGAFEEAFGLGERFEGEDFACRSNGAGGGESHDAEVGANVNEGVAGLQRIPQKYPRARFHVAAGGEAGDHGDVVGGEEDVAGRASHHQFVGADGDRDAAGDLAREVAQLVHFGKEDRLDFFAHGAADDLFERACD